MKRYQSSTEQKTDINNRPPYQARERPCVIKEVPAYEGLGSIFGFKLIIERER